MKLLASDYDDTLLIDNTISEKDLKAIGDLQSQGHLFGLNSGRHLNSLFEECDRFNLKPDFYIGNNGTVVLDRNRKQIYMAKFDQQAVNEVLDYFRTHLKEEVFFISVNNGYDFGREFFHPGCPFLPEHNLGINSYLDKPISTMFSHVLERDNTMPLVKQLRDHFKNRVYFYGNAPFIDITNEDIDKASGIKHIAQHYHIDKKQCYCVGDAYNDMSMLSTFNGYAMAHAKDSVKAIAKGEVHSVSEVIEIMLR